MAACVAVIASCRIGDRIGPRATGLQAGV